MKKYYYEGSTFKLWRESWGPTYELWKRSWGPTFKFWGGIPGPGSQGHEVLSRGPGPTFTPCPEKRCVENYCLFGKAQIFPYKSVEFQTSVNIKRIAYVYQKRDQKFIKKYFTWTYVIIQTQKRYPTLCNKVIT